MEIKNFLIRKEEIIKKIPGVGDKVVFLNYNARRRRYMIMVGIITKIFDSIYCSIDDNMRCRNDILFVMNDEGYRRINWNVLAYKKY